jgi:hypothetical protein
MTLPPPLSDEERSQAGAAGVAARRVRAQVRRGLSAGTTTLGEVLALAQVEGPEGRSVARMRVADLLAGLRGIGPVRAADIMAEVGIAANRRIGGLGVHQAAALVETIEARAARGRR